MRHHGFEAKRCRPYQVTHSTARTVSVEALVRYETNGYSVPARWVGARVSVDAGNQVIHIRAGDLVIAQHPVNAGCGQRTESPLHVIRALGALGAERAEGAAQRLPHHLRPDRAGQAP